MDGALVELRKGKERIRVRTDGNGFFGKTDLAPGKWLIRFPHSAQPPVAKRVKVEAGQVTEMKSK
jgi:hypothetical protein